nr:MAG TPA: hypothetical protein [Bacteriophage sp.]
MHKLQDLWQSSLTPNRLDNQVALPTHQLNRPD